MADMGTLQQRAMLRGYEQQLLAARRLARFRVRRRIAQGEEPYDPDPAIKRRAFVEQVAQELYESLLFTGSDNPVVEEIRESLSGLVGMELEFTYPPGEKLCVVGKGPHGPRTLTEEEQRRIRNALWRITRQKVDQSLLVKPSGLRA